MHVSIGRKRRLQFNFSLGGGVRAVIARLTEMHRAIEGRRAIARMDARMLSDIGLSHGEALEEASRRPWDTVRRRV